MGNWWWVGFRLSSIAPISVPFLLPDCGCSVTSPPAVPTAAPFPPQQTDPQESLQWLLVRESATATEEQLGCPHLPQRPSAFVERAVHPNLRVT